MSHFCALCASRNTCNSCMAVCFFTSATCKNVRQNLIRRERAECAARVPLACALQRAQACAHAQRRSMGRTRLFSHADARGKWTPKGLKFPTYFSSHPCLVSKKKKQVLGPLSATGFDCWYSDIDINYIFKLCAGQGASPKMLG